MGEKMGISFFQADGRSGDEHVCSSLSAAFDSFRPDPAVDLNPDIAVGSGRNLTGPLHLGEHVGHKGLTTEARLDGHDQDHVDEVAESIDLV